MPIVLYNTLSRSKEPFIPRDEGVVSIYACGLTPQGPAHLGHMRGALAFDAICRWLRYRGFTVKMVQNFTDIDDKIIRKAAEEGTLPSTLASRYAQEYLKDWDSLKIGRVEFVKVTENIGPIVELIVKLIDRGHAYLAANGDVYFSVKTFPEYGKLSGRDPNDMEAGSRIEVDPDKLDPLDFALWKAERPGEPAWDSPMGRGRPGWHIECSALSLKFLGNSFDIHAGGIDLLFPHHENEVAQSEAATGEAPFARYWAHWGAVNTGGVKMSKSLGNFFTIREILAQYPADVLRLYLLSTHYRNPIDYDPQRLAETARAYEGLKNALAVASQVAAPGEPQIDPQLWEKFSAAMDDDFNTAQAIGVAFEARSEMNRQMSSAESDPAVVRDLAATIRMMLGTVGIEIEKDGAVAGAPGLADTLVEKAIVWRAMAREARQFALADRIRDDLKSIGVSLEDRLQGTTWRID